MGSLQTMFEVLRAATASPQHKYLPFENEQELWLAHKAKQELGPAQTDPRDIDAAIFDRGGEGGYRNPSTPGTVDGKI
jgi:hypothetical protein